jgi:hypothetical protein
MAAALCPFKKAAIPAKDGGFFLYGFIHIPQGRFLPAPVCDQTAEGGQIVQFFQILKGERTGLRLRYGLPLQQPVGRFKR